MYYDKKHDVSLEQVGEAAAAEGGGAGGALGGDLGADMGGDMGGDMGMPEELAGPAEPEGTEDPGSLLAMPSADTGPPADDAAPEAPPGKRDPDKRNGSPQAMKAATGMQNIGRTQTSIWPGRKDISSVYRGLSEEKEFNYYDEEEKKLLKETYETKKLIDSLEELEKNSDEI
jgi:hypothetical protein